MKNIEYLIPSKVDDFKRQENAIHVLPPQKVSGPSLLVGANQPILLVIAAMRPRLDRLSMSISTEMVSLKWIAARISTTSGTTWPAISNTARVPGIHQPAALVLT